MVVGEGGQQPLNASYDPAALTQRLPLGIRRYLRIDIAASATAGDNTATKATLAA
jgi:hypothetical protein